MELSLQLTFVVLIGISVTLTAARSAGCKEGWTGFGNSCYFFTRAEGTWHEGRLNCLEKGADLVKITTDEEFSFLAARATREMWVGLNDISQEGQYVWASDKSRAIINKSWFQPGQPDNYKNREDCVHFAIWDQSLLNDEPCGHRRSFICEMARAS